MTITIESGITIGDGIIIGPAPIISPKIQHIITPSGNAQVSTTQVKFGTGSYTSNSLAGRLSVTPFSDFSWGTSDFTIEFWYYPTSTDVRSSLIDFRISAHGPYISFFANDTASLSLYANASFRLSTPNNSIVVGQWNPIALVRVAGQTRIYINGIQRGGTFNDTIVYQALTCVIGSNTLPTLGYIDEVRFSDIARYTSNYTPATEPFVADAYTVFLMNCDGTDGSTVFLDSSGNTV
jgi:hypothetical protein